MCCYLYCAFTMKKDVQEGVTEEQLASIQRWRRTIMQIAVEEMLHMCLACNLLTAVGGHDAHANVRLLGSLGWVIGNYDEVFRVLSTHVLSTGLDEAAIVDALRQGRSYVVFDLWRDGSGFAFWAEDRGVVKEMGSVVSPTATLRVRTPVPAQILLYRDGVVAATATDGELSFGDPAPGV